MKKLLRWLSLSILSVLLTGCMSEGNKKLQDEMKMSKDVLADKIKGGWAGKTIGCAYGGPVEFIHNGTFINDDTPIKWTKDRVKYYFDTFPGLYDDIYVNIIFINVFNRLGLNAPADSFAVSFADTKFPLWHANQVARYNIKNGIMPPYSGHWLNNPHADDIDYQIEADFAGLMTPGMPNTSAEISDRIGHIFTYGDGWYGGVYIGAMYSLAFIYNDIATVVTEALNVIPSKSDFYQCIQDVINWHKQYPDDWKQTWFEVQKKWSSEVGCPDGVFLPFNIDAKINAAYVVMGLLYGNGDFFKTMDVAARCGQDSDCNASTAVGVLGTMMGYSNIPVQWKESLNGVENINFDYTDVSLNKLTELTLKLAIAEIESNGGLIDSNIIKIKVQTPVAVKYEKSFENHYPKEKLPVNKLLQDSVSYDFDGNGIVQKGYVSCTDPNYVAEIEVYIDNKLVEQAKLPAASSNQIDDRRVDLFHKYQLENTAHAIKYKWLNPNGISHVYLGEAVIYSNNRGLN